MKEIKPTTYSGKVQYAKALANGYLKLSDQAAAAQDATAVALILTAGVAAGALLYDGSLDLVKGAGLAAGTLSAASTYFSPAETSSLLLDAADQLVCISQASQPPPADTVSGAEVLSTGIMTVRLNLRRKFNRKLPDYKQLIQNLRVSLTGITASDVHERTLLELRAAINECVL